MADDLADVASLDLEEEKVIDDDFSPAKVLAPSQDPVDLEDELHESDIDHPHYSAAPVTEEDEEKAEVENYFFNGFDNDAAPYEAEELAD